MSDETMVIIKGRPKHFEQGRGSISQLDKSLSDGAVVPNP
jgi:hypothetical protein